VTQLQLPRLGLQGTLPGQLAQLPSLALLDLSGNAFEGGIPEAWLQRDSFPSLTTALLGGNKLGGAPLPSGLLSLATQRIDVGSNRFNGSLPANWSSSSLVDLDLRDNQLTGTLPANWGGDAVLPQLALLHLQGNKLSGLVPDAWTAGAFAAPLMMESRPGNQLLCGAVVPLNPKLFPEGHPERNSPIIPAANSMRTGDNLTTVVLIQRGLFVPTTSVTITNWLGSCAVPCNEGTLPSWQAPALHLKLQARPTCMVIEAAALCCLLAHSTLCHTCLPRSPCSARLAHCAGRRVGSRAELAANG
jgi:hypothetical protein